MAHGKGPFGMDYTPDEIVDPVILAELAAAFATLAAYCESRAAHFKYWTSGDKEASEASGKAAEAAFKRLPATAQWIRHSRR